jgi:competence protein ComEA
MFKNKKGIFILFSAVLFLAFSYYNQDSDQISKLNSENKLNILEAADLQNNSSVKEAKEIIVVHLAGAVKNAGVYKLDKNDRLVDLIKAAGGLKDNADLTQINLAEKLYDGQKFTVAEIKKTEDKTTLINLKAKNSKERIDRNFNSSDNSSFININQADQSQLEKLSGIGASKAAAIIKYREEKSYFSEKEDLLKISGIGEKTLENIRDEIVLQ